VTADEQVIEGILQQIETVWNRFCYFCWPFLVPIALDLLGRAWQVRKFTPTKMTHCLNNRQPTACSATEFRVYETSQSS